MELQVIREFIALTRMKSFSEVSDAYYMSPSTLSKHIQALELELGYPLFTRTARTVELNAQGQLFLSYAIRIISAFDQYKTEVERSSRDSEQWLSIGLVSAMSQDDIADILMNFQTQNEHIKINIVSDTPPNLEALLRGGTCDFVFSRVIQKPDNELSWIYLSTEKIAAVLPSSHELARQKYIHIRELRDEVFLFQVPDQVLYNHYLQICRGAGFEPNIGLTAYMENNIIDLVGRGYGVSLLIEKHAINLQSPDIAVVDILPGTDIKLYLAHRNDVEMTRAGKRFLEYVKAMYASEGQPA